MWQEQAQQSSVSLGDGSWFGSFIHPYLDHKKAA
jgi:hypothetical protein